MEVSENNVECYSPRNEASLYSVNLDSISKAELADKKAANEMNNTKDIINDRPVPKPRIHPNSDSSYSIDVLSGGESENENLWKRNYSSSHILKLPVTSKDGVDYPTGTSTSDIKSMKRSSQGDKGFYIAKEILMTERTFKRDLEVIATLLRRVIPDELEHEFCDSPIWVPLDCLLSVQGPALRGLEFKLSANPGDVNGNCSNKSTGGIMLDYLKESLPFYDKWIGEHFEYIQHLEEACVNSPMLEKACRDAELYQGECYLPINTFLLKPLYRLLHLRKVLEFALGECQEDEELLDLQKCIELIKPLYEGVKDILPKSLNFSYLCMLHRDIEGIDNLVQLDRHFLRQGCLYKHSSKGPQQRMFFLFSDILVYTSKSYSPHQQFRIHGIIQLSTLTVDSSQFNNSFTLYGNGKAMTISASSASDRDAWLEDIKNATLQFQPSGSWENVNNSRSTSATNSAEELSESGENSTSMVQRSNTLSHVCWHRNTSLSWAHLYHGMENQLSGYLLRKFKNSLGWQKLWVVFASFCLYFYKTCHDEHPLASLPLLGYSVTTPNEKDCINKDFVFKLVFKNHTYFFRAESDYTFKRWMDVIGSATIQMATTNNNS